MKIWLSKNSEVPVREQITTQITLGITSGDLPVGERLPSTHEIARRFEIHPNTVSNAYQILAEQGWIEFKKGSGFFVCEITAGNVSGKLGLDEIIADFLNTARGRGFSKKEIRSRLNEWFSSKKPKKILVIESDEELRAILVEEIQQSKNLRVKGASLVDFTQKHQNSNSVFVAMKDEMPKIQSVLTPDKSCLYLVTRSVSDSMSGQARPDPDQMVAVVSGWGKFLSMAKTMLIAAGLDGDALIIRNTAAEDWQKGLKNAAMVICDSLTAKQLTDQNNIRTFKLVSDESLKELVNLTI